jgi:hypothetical protein
MSLTISKNIFVTNQPIKVFRQKIVLQHIEVVSCCNYNAVNAIKFGDGSTIWQSDLIW